MHILHYARQFLARYCCGKIMSLLLPVLALAYADLQYGYGDVVKIAIINPMRCVLGS